MTIPKTICDREYNKFVESQKRPSDPRANAVEVCVGNNTDNPIPVLPVDAADVGDPINVYAESLSVAIGANVTVLSYTVPALKEFVLKRVSYSSTVKSEHIIDVDASTIAKKRIYCTDFNGEFIFENQVYTAGAVIKLVSTNKAPLIGDINGNLQGILRDA